MIVQNPREYEEKAPTNIRLIREVKDLVIAEAKEKKTTLADIINGILRQHYLKEE